MRQEPFLVPPYKNKMVEPIALLPRHNREKKIAEAHYNTFLLKSEDVYIDLLTDSGTSAMSDRQWSVLMRGDESYAGSQSFYTMESAVKEIYGYKFVVPTHQGRGAEHLISRVLLGGKKNLLVPNNLYFTTSRLHQELAGGTWIDVSIDEASDPEFTYLFKGNIDVGKLTDIISKYGPENIGFVRIEASLNMAGGQPFSMDNLRQVSILCKECGIFLLLDATRISENALFVKTREPECQNKKLREIIKEMCSLTDGCTFSSKKDHYVNIGGFLAINDSSIYRKASEQVVCFEGLHTYGGMSGRDMNALAVGIYESACEDYVRHYTKQVEFLGDCLRRTGIPIVEPAGAHAVFIDAKRFLDHLEQYLFPAQTLASEIYIEGGVRSMERGIVSGQHGSEPYGGLELVRLAIPRRVYETAHLQYVADAICGVWQKRHTVKGLKMTYEPENLRFFQAHFEPII